MDSESSKNLCTSIIIDPYYNLTETLCYYQSENQQKANQSLQIDAENNDLGSVDYLVLTAFLLLSIGISLTRSLSANSDTDVQHYSSKESSSDEKQKNKKEKSILAVLSVAGALVSPFVNTLCLFSVNGEAFATDTNIIFVFIGILLSVLLISVSSFYSILRDNNIDSISEYLKKRYQSKTSGLMVIFASILRQIIGGVLNLHIVGVVVSSMTKLSASVIYITISVASVICVSASKIHTRASTSFGGTFIWLLAITIIITMCVVTSNSGGFSALIYKAYEEDKFRIPRFSVLPWERNAIWGFLFMGIFMGVQIYGFSRVALRCSNDLSPRTMNSSIAVSLIFVFLWLLLGLWCGLCTSVTFHSSTIRAHELSPRSIDGSLSKMVSIQMQNHKGFRGFFIAALLAASISGLARRFNQLIGLVYITFKDCKDLCFTPKPNQTLQKEILKRAIINIPEDAMKQIEWEERQRTCFPICSFKFIVGGLIAVLSLWLVWILHTSNERIWELWISVIGILNGTVLSALFLGMFCPCIPHYSVVMGLIMGWVIPCCLAIGNRIFIRPGLLYFQDISFFEAVWDRDNQKDQNKFELFSQRNRRKFYSTLSVQHKVFSTSFAYYGLVGFLSCLLSALIITILIRQCHPVPNIPTTLIHPRVSKNLRTSIENPFHSSQSPRTRTSKRKKHRAMSLVQETVGV